MIPRTAGLLLNSAGRACGICGTVRKLSRTHVPAQAAGNTRDVLRSDSGYGPGRWNEGGMWVRGLCVDCNGFAGQRYDRAYGDFAKSVEVWADVGTRAYRPAVPAVQLAPGRVTRSILSGMLGIRPHVREFHPALAARMQAGGAVRLPGGLSLWIGGYLGTYAQLTGPMITGLTDGTGRAVNTLAAVTFRPLSRALATCQSEDLLRELGWIDATEWLRYADDRESVDLRWLIRAPLAFMRSALHAPTDDGFTLYSSEISPIMAGRLPS